MADQMAVIPGARVLPPGGFRPGLPFTPAIQIPSTSIVTSTSDDSGGDVISVESPAPSALTSYVIPVVSTMVGAYVLEKVVDLIISAYGDGNTDEERMYKLMQTDMKRHFKSNPLSQGDSVGEVQPPVIQVVPIQVPVPSPEWMKKVESAHELLASAEKEVKCKRCKRTISGVRTQLKTGISEMSANDRKLETMEILKEQGRIPKNRKTWKDLTDQERVLVKKSAS